MTISKTYKIVAFISIALFVVIYMGNAMMKVSVSNINDAIIVFVYIDKNINEKLAIEDAEILMNIVNGKRLFWDYPSCGFTPDISFRFENMIFSVAKDTCTIIRVETKHEVRMRKAMKRHIYITKEERQKVEEIFNKYGGYFPCV